MLPKINQKAPAKDVIPYHTFAREIMTRKISDNNISKLKLIKQFLEDEQFEPKVQEKHFRAHKLSDLGPEQVFELQRFQNIQIGKENVQKMKKIRRQSLTSQARTSQHREKVSLDKEKLFIFSVPDRFKLNELLLGPKTKKTVIKDFLNNSLKMNNQLYTHRIL